MPSDIGLHEAAHCCALWRAGVKVQCVEITDNDSGQCTAEEPSDPLDAVVVAIIGGIAEHALGTSPNDAMSIGDKDNVQFAEWRFAHTVNNQQRRYYKTLARDLVFELKAEIEALASLLDKRRRLTADDLAALCHTTGSPFIRWQRLYPKPPSSRAPTRREDMPDLAGLIRGLLGGNSNMRRVSPAGAFL